MADGPQIKIKDLFDGGRFRRVDDLLGFTESLLSLRVFDRFSFEVKAAFVDVVHDVDVALAGSVHRVDALERKLLPV